VTVGGAGKLPKKTVDFGTEVPLGSLPDAGIPATAPAAV